jgi:hypothetical protein
MRQNKWDSLAGGVSILAPLEGPSTEIGLAASSPVFFDLGGSPPLTFR